MAIEKTYTPLNGTQTVFDTDFGVFSTGAVRVFFSTDGITENELFEPAGFTSDGIEDGSTNVEITIPAALGENDPASYVKLVLKDNIAVPSDHIIVDFTQQVNPNSEELKNQFLLIIQDLLQLAGSDGSGTPADISESVDISGVTDDILALFSRITAIAGMLLDTVATDDDGWDGTGVTSQTLESLIVDVGILSGMIGGTAGLPAFGTGNPYEVLRMTSGGAAVEWADSETDAKPAAKLLTLNRSLTYTPFTVLQLGDDPTKVATVQGGVGTAGSLAVVALQTTGGSGLTDVIQENGQYGCNIRAASHGAASKIPDTMDTQIANNNFHGIIFATMDYEFGILSYATNLNFIVSVAATATHPGTSDPAIGVGVWCYDTAVDNDTLKRIWKYRLKEESDTGSGAVSTPGVARISTVMTVPVSAITALSGAAGRRGRIFLTVGAENHTGTDDLDLSIMSIGGAWFT